ncbi:MAG: DUF169 domain-containing protein [Spirochaetaceae bacterium]|jgi:uncharacterized protein (DUF169 family)|nr:DUF169 domain-containing protein [Spirochaetaceae bacterium]
MNITDKRDFADYQNRLTVLLGLNRAPVGIRLLKTDEDLRDSAALMPEGGLPYCAAVSKAGKGGRCKLGPRNMYCKAGANALNIVKPDEDRVSGKVYEKFKVYRDGDICKNIGAGMVYLEESNAGVEIMPLADFESTPDIVIIVANPKTVMRIVQGYAYHFGHLKNIRMSGMCAICNECTSYPYTTGDMNVSMLCAGTRCVGGWGDDELAAGIPFEKCRLILDGIEQTANPMENAQSKLQITERAKIKKTTIPPLDINYTYYKGGYGPIA